MKNIDVGGGEGRRVLGKDLGRSLGFKVGKHYVKNGQMELGKRKESRKWILMNSLIAGSYGGEREGERERLSELCFSWVPCTEQQE